MKGFFKELTALLMSIFILLGSLMIIPPTANAVGSYPANQGDVCVAEYDKIFGNVPPPNGIKCVQKISGPGAGSWVQFNWTLYKALNVIAYGTPDSASGTGDTGFDTTWQDQYGNKYDNDTSKTIDGVVHPYFSLNGEKGEYRYYGWDKNGNLYTNPFFRRDASSGVNPNSMKYFYRPWDSNSHVTSSNKPKNFGDLWNGTFSSPEQIYSQGKVSEVNSIIKSKDITVRNIAKDSNPDTHVPGQGTTKNLFDYMYVEQAPTSQTPGSGRLYHQNDNGSIWYQSFAIDRLTSKKRLGVDAIIEPDKKNYTGDISKAPEDMTFKWNLSGKLLDDSIDLSKQYNRTAYFTRFDVDYWVMVITYSWPGGTKTETLRSDNGGLVLQKNKQIAIRNPNPLTLNLKKSDFKTGKIYSGELTVTLQVKAYYYNNPSTPDTDSAKWSSTLGGDVPQPAPDETQSGGGGGGGSGGTQQVICSANTSSDAFDIVPYSDVHDTTDPSKVTGRSVSIDGNPVDADEFWSGQYVFGENSAGVHRVNMSWDVQGGGINCDTYRDVVVHDTKPHAQFKINGGLWKENRKFTVDNTSNDPSANDALVLATYPNVSTQWTWSVIDGSDSDRRMKVDGSDHKEFLYKKPGEYALTLTVTNSLGRTSDPTTIEFSVLPDYDPAVILHPYSSQISRNEPLTLFYDAVSTDGDIITKQHFDVYYDINGDETYSQLIDSFDSPISQYTPPTNKLGKYRIVAHVDESYGQDTFSEFLNMPEDSRSSSAQFEFEVDNLIPYADIATDIPSERQQVDTAILLDKNLAQSKIDYVNGNGVTINNQLRYTGIDPNVSSWDMHTYVYTQPASEVKHTGGYPPSTDYYCSNGYCGTLQFQSASDQGSYQDHGSYVTIVDSPAYSYCNWTSPSGITYTHGGTCDVASHGVTVPAVTHQEWVPNIVWVSNWYGTYSGTIEKDVRQPFSNPYVRATASRYLVYISDDIINEPSDFNMVKGLSDAKVILVGNANIKNQTNYDYFIANTGQPIEDIIQSVVDYIASQNPPTASQTVLINEPFNLVTDQTDPENDPIVQQQTMYVHNENFYDNPLGHDPNSLSDYDATKWTDQELRTSFSLPGQYKVYRRVRDLPSTDPKLAKYSYWSNEPYTIINVNRKPIAKATLDWNYDETCDCYKTTWTDQSYDLDHNISDPVNKGIIDRKIKYTVNGQSYYQIPDELPAGTYHLEYYVEDMEHEWSDPFIMDFTLNSVPPVQFQANLASRLPYFTIPSMPASEDLRIYNIWTRYPYSTSLDYNIGNPAGTSNNTTPTHVNYFTGTKSGDDIWWNDIFTTIPNTLQDGDYAVKIKANGTVPSATTTLLLPFTVYTPINLTSDFPSTVVVNQPYQINASTTKYPNSATAILYYGTSYARTISLTPTTTSTTGIGGQTWSSTAFNAYNVPDGTYILYIKATNPSGKTEVWTGSFNSTHNRPPVSKFACTPTNGYEGDVINCTNQSTDPDGDAMTYKWVVTGPNGYSATFTSTNISIPSTVTTNRPGSYSIRLTATDSKGAVNTADAVGSVFLGQLYVEGLVNHTSQWELNRQSWNAKMTNKQRASNVFWAGERFDLIGNPTITDSSGGSSTVASSVTVSATGIGSTSLTKANVSDWTGHIGSDNASVKLDSLADGAYDFTFTATFSNGVVKQDTVRIYIQDKWDNYFRVFRDF